MRDIQDKIINNKGTQHQILNNMLDLITLIYSIFSLDREQMQWR